MEEKNTIIVNLIGAPSAGKSTMMAEIFAKLKWNKIECEMVSEFAKELVWEERFKTMEDEIYIFAKQEHSLFRVAGKVDVIVTDRPLILTMIYDKRYGKGSKELNALVLSEFNRYNNLNYFINRKKPYNPNGRVQTQAESDEIAEDIKNILRENSIDFKEVDGLSETSDKIVEEIVSKLA